MKRTAFFLIIATSSLMSPLVLLSPLSAQTIWLNQGQDNSIAIEVLKPEFDGDDDFTFISTAWFLSGRFSLGENVMIAGELPIAHGGIDTDFGVDESQTVIGNPYVGFEIRRQGSSMFAEIGVRPPLTPDDNPFASFVGLFSDFDRLEAFTPDILTVTGKVNYHRTNASKVVFRIRGGTALLINTEGKGDDTELFLDYSGQVGYEGDQFSLIGGLTGRFLASEDGDLGERTVLQLGLAASVGLRNVRPGIHLRIPLDDDLTGVLDLVAGLNLGVQLR
ncbi:MAG: hypothetical protein ACE5NG_04715 [bacterium]